METQTKTEDWLNAEIGTLETPLKFEELPSLKLTPNQITTISIDFSKPFDKWTGESGNKTITKKIIPVMVNGVKMNWWLNVKNPVYREILESGQKGMKEFKVLQTGNKADTKYVLVK